jgi:imidazolonepropionase
VRGHAGQFRDLGAAELIGALGGRSADHVEQISDAGIAALAAAGTVAVMLPGACVQLRLPVPPVARLRAAGVALAIASDLNPGSSYCETLAIQMWLATTHFGMTVDEAWLGVTRHAATALGLPGEGTITAGARGDLVVWRCDEPAAVPYRYGAAAQLIDRVIVAGA